MKEIALARTEVGDAVLEVIERARLLGMDVLAGALVDALAESAEEGELPESD